MWDSRIIVLLALFFFFLCFSSFICGSVTKAKLLLISSLWIHTAGPQAARGRQARKILARYRRWRPPARLSRREEVQLLYLEERRWSVWEHWRWVFIRWRYKKKFGPVSLANWPGYTYIFFFFFGNICVASRLSQHDYLETCWVWLDDCWGVSDDWLQNCEWICCRWRPTAVAVTHVVSSDDLGACVGVLEKKHGLKMYRLATVQIHCFYSTC